MLNTLRALTLEIYVHHSELMIRTEGAVTRFINYIYFFVKDKLLFCNLLISIQELSIRDPRIE
jgi:hypothetical protein